MMLALKYLIGSLADPLVIAFLLALVALIFRLTGRRKLAWGTFSAGVGFAYLCSLSWVGDVFLAPLEARYPTFLESSVRDGDVAAILVLGAWYAPRENLPITAALSGDGLSRIAEGVRLAMRYPSAKLIVSGGAPHGGAPSALGYARFAKEFGLAQDRLVISANALDTRQEAREVAKRYPHERFILVTSAGHMPRSMALMEREGLHPIPAPTAQRTAGNVTVDHWQSIFLPSSLGLAKTEAAWHEYLGLAALSLGLD
jgi:uncharacterized SAM-binding protein YcdF (DUF218 family)